MNNNEIKFWIWFSRIENVNNIQKEKILKRYKSISKIWSLTESDYRKIDGLDENCIKEFVDLKYRENIEVYQKYLLMNNIRIITILDKEYPSYLMNIYDKPIVLFAKGNIKLLNKKSIAIVGARKCSVYGRETAKKIAYNLAKNDICIISGLARGIDKYAHIGALEAGGNTVAVIGNGLDNIYPYENQDLSERIVKNNGLIVTEYIIGTKPNKVNFPARNRIISGLSDGIVVVEASKKSGALITANIGLEQGKEIYAVPGNIDSPMSVGTNELIRDGANVVLNYNDVLETI